MPRVAKSKKSDDSNNSVSDEVVAPVAKSKRCKSSKAKAKKIEVVEEQQPKAAIVVPKKKVEEVVEQRESEDEKDEPSVVEYVPEGSVITEQSAPLRGIPRSEMINADTSHTNKDFFAETPKGFLIKGLVDVLTPPLTRVSFKIDKEGIHVRQKDKANMILFDVDLKRGNFRLYRCNKPVKISVNLKQVQKRLKNIKKKESISIYIDPAKKGILTFIVRPEGARKTARFERINVTFEEENFDDIDLPPLDGYQYPMVIDAPDFQRIKKLTTENKMITTTMQKNNYLCFGGGKADSDDIVFGELLNEPEEYEEDDKKDDAKDGVYKGIYTAQFYSSILSYLIKFPCLCTQMQIFAPSIDHYPIRIAINLTQGNITLGTAQAFVKDVQQIQYEESLRRQQEAVVVPVPKAKSKKVKV